MGPDLFSELFGEGMGMRMHMGQQRPRSAGGCSNEYIKNLPPKEAAPTSTSRTYLP